MQPNVEDGRLSYIGADDAAQDLTGITIIDSVIQYCGMDGKAVQSLAGSPFPRPGG